MTGASRGSAGLSDKRTPAARPVRKAAGLSTMGDGRATEEGVGPAGGLVKDASPMEWGSEPRNGFPWYEHAGRRGPDDRVLVSHPTPWATTARRTSSDEQNQCSPVVGRTRGQRPMQRAIPSADDGARLSALPASPTSRSRRRETSALRSRSQAAVARPHAVARREMPGATLHDAVPSDKGTPVARPVRKATGLSTTGDGRAVEEGERRPGGR